MAFSVKVTVPPVAARTLAELQAPQLNDTLTRFLVDAGLRVQRNAASKQIARGGRGKPLLRRLTSRTGTLRRSIRVDRKGTPAYVDIGTDLVYGAVHELGGTFGVPRHSRVSSLGTRYDVRAHTARYPRRPFIEPAIEDEAPGFEALLLGYWREAVYQA